MRRSLLALLLVSACGGAPPRTGLGELLDVEQVSEARVRAPDLVAEAEAAAADAEQAHLQGRDEAASDHTTRARLLLEAAVVESQRLAIEEERLEVDARAEAHSALAARIESERAARAAEIARERASQIAVREAARAFEVAEADEARRLARRSTEVQQTRRQATSALLDRAGLLLAACRVLGAEEARLAELEERVAAARALPDVDDALRAADAAHGSAMLLLGEVRSGSSPTPEMRRGLLRMLQERRFDASAGTDGVHVVVRPTGLASLAEILGAHPHGPVILVGSANETRRLRTTLVEGGVPEDRIAVRVVRAPLHLVMSGYADGR